MADGLQGKVDTWNEHDHHARPRGDSIPSLDKGSPTGCGRAFPRVAAKDRSALFVEVEESCSDKVVGTRFLCYGAMAVAISFNLQ